MCCEYLDKNDWNACTLKPTNVCVGWIKWDNEMKEIHIDNLIDFCKKPELYNNDKYKENFQVPV